MLASRAAPFLYDRLDYARLCIMVISFIEESFCIKGSVAHSAG